MTGQSAAFGSVAPKLNNLSLMLLLSILFACQPDSPSSDTPDPLPEPAADYEDNPYPWGFIDNTGNLVIQSRFDEVRPFSDGLALVRTEGRWGYIDKRGQLSIPPTLRAAWPFVNGRARAQQVDGKFGYINTSGEWIISAEYADLSEFSEGLASFRKDESYGYIDTTGTITIDAQFDKAAAFENNEAVVAIDNQYGIIDRSGNPILKYQYERLKPFQGDIARARRQGLYGYLNRKGEWTIDPQFRQASDFQRGVAAAATEDRWGLIDTDGQWIMEPQYDQLFYAGEDRWIAANGQSYLLLTSLGEPVTTRSYTEIQPFSEGFAPYQERELWGYLRPDGSTMTASEYYLAWPYKNGLARVATRYGLTFIDSLGRQLFNPRANFFELRDFSEGLAPVEIY